MKHRASRQRSRADLGTLVELGRLFLVETSRDRILSEISSDHLHEAVDACMEFLTLEEQGFQMELRTRHGRVRQHSPAFLEDVGHAGQTELS